MANKRKKLEARAEKLGLTFVPETTDEELKDLIEAFENTNDENSGEDSDDVPPKGKVDEDSEEDLEDEDDPGEPEKEPEGADGLGIFGEGYRFFKSMIPGLSIHFGDEPARTEQPQTVRFTAYEFWDEDKGERMFFGYLATDEEDAIEVMADDVNVEEISEKEYRKAVKTGKLAKT